MGAGASLSWGETSGESLKDKKIQVLDHVEAIYASKKQEISGEELLALLEQEYLKKKNKVGITSEPTELEEKKDDQEQGNLQLTPRTYERMVSLATKAQAQHQENTFLVCVDGSENSSEALQTVMRLRKGGDRVKCIHVSDPSKSYLPSSMQPDKVKEASMIQLVSNIPSDRYDFTILEKRSPEESTKNLIVNYVNSTFLQDQKSSQGKPKFVVTGFVGRKGRKDDPSILGEVSDMSLRCVLYPSIVVKTLTRHQSQGHRHFVVGVDGRQRGHQAYLVAQTLTKPQDKLTALHVWDGNDDSQSQLPEKLRVSAVQEFYTKDIADRGLIDGEFVALKKDSGIAISQAMLNWLDEMEVDFVALGVRPSMELSSVCDVVVKNCKCSVIICKTGKDEVLENI
mmetsp:Transcript_32250/g.41354  ORF Transcript_32250/g.41354 Transcript_32250/m.41354 type:complete len:398 (-) Transcript_32250:106-1299(-)